MMRKTIFLALLGSVLLGAQARAQDPNFHIYLSFGQSNMEGYPRFEPQDTVVADRFLVLQAVDCANLNRVRGQWYPAVAPLARCNTGLSPANYFGRTMVAQLPRNIKVGVINVAVGGCKIELFDKAHYGAYVAQAPAWLVNMVQQYDGNPYAQLVELGRLAQQKGVIKGILLHQGESNTGDTTWPAKVKAVYQSLLQDLNLQAAAVPLLAGEVVHAEQGGVCGSMNAIIAKLPQAVPNAYVISSKGCTDAPDNLHFDAAGVRELGRRYAVQMLSLLGYTKAAQQ